MSGRSPALWLGALLSAAPGCSDSASSSASPPPTFSAIYPALFPAATRAKCDFCHGLPANDISNGKLAMGTDRATAYAALVGATSTSSLCGGRKLVIPGDPEGSLLVQKLGGTPPCGDHMPLGGGSITAEELGMVRSWVASGAKDD